MATYLVNQAFVAWAAAKTFTPTAFGPNPFDTYVSMITNHMPGCSYASHKYFDKEKANKFMDRPDGDGAFGVYFFSDGSMLIQYTNRKVGDHFMTFYAIVSAPDENGLQEIYDAQTFNDERGSIRKEVWLPAVK